jgi:hypothetical protein
VFDRQSPSADDWLALENPRVKRDAFKEFLLVHHSIPIRKNSRAVPPSFN